MEVQSRSVALIGAPLEEGSGRSGAAMGPTALRIAGIDKALSDLGHTVVDDGRSSASSRPATSPTIRSAQQSAHRRRLYARARSSHL